jgi:hypothetical protein
MNLPVRYLLTGALCLMTTSAAFAADESYDVKPKAAKATVGEKATASVTISTKKGWHLNAEAPLTLKLTPGPDVTVDKPKLTRADLAASSENSARFDVSLAVARPGTSEIAAEAGFVLCQESECRPIKEKLTIGVDALPAKPVADKPNKKK